MLEERVMDDDTVEEMSGSESQSNSAIKISPSSQIKVEFAKCDCCGLTEECTLAYIERTREKYQGKWICGLCAEAVEDEIFRSEMLISNGEALNRHMNFCKKFKSSCPPTNTTEHLISAVRQILRRSLDSPRPPRSSPSSPSRKTTKDARRPLARSESCFPTLAG